MSSRPDPDLSSWQVAMRVLFACAVTVIVIFGIYVAIRWLAGA